MSTTLIPHIIALESDGKEGKIYSIDEKNGLIIGRDKQCAIRVKVPSISRQHAKIGYDDNRKLSYFHLSSVNPSMINGEVVKKTALLKDGDILTFGDSLFQKELRRALSTPLRKAIQGKTQLKKAAVRSETPNKPSRGLPTPLRQAIQKRREAVEKAALASPNNNMAEVVTNANVPPAVTVHIHFDSPPAGVEKQEVSVKSVDYRPAPKKINFFDELREALAARRKRCSLGSSTAGSAVSPTRLPQRVVQNAVSPLRVQATPKKVATPQRLATPKRKPMPTPLRKAIEGKQHVEEEEEGKVQAETANSTEAVEAVEEVKENSVEEEEEVVAVPVSTEEVVQADSMQVEELPKQEEETAAVVEHNVEQEKVEQVESNVVSTGEVKEEEMQLEEIEEVKGEKEQHEEQVVAEEQDAAVNEENLEVLLNQDILLAASMQIVKEAFELEVRSPGRRLSGRLSLPFSPLRTPARKPRARESLLGSLQRKVRVDGEMAEDPIAALTDEELELIEGYADRLPETDGIDDMERFAIALDAYLRGIEQAQQWREAASKSSEGSDRLIAPLPSSPSRSEVPATAAAASSSPQVDQVAKTESVEVSAPAAAPAVEINEQALDGLWEMFVLPPAYLDALHDDLDHQLVEVYAEEIRCATGVDEGVAFGVALDAFLADPVAFRHRIGHLALPEEDDEPEVEDNETVIDAADSAAMQVEAANDTVQEVAEAAVTTAEQVKATEEPEVKKSEPAKKRGRKTVKVVAETEESHEEKVEKKEEEVDEKKEESLPPITPRRSTRRGAVDATTPLPAEAVTPARRTRNQAASQTPAVTPKKSTTKRAASAPSTSKPKGRKRKQEQEEEEEEEEEALAILCDGCDGEFFVDELGLKAVPEGDWFCAACEKKRKRSRTTKK
eukprot:gene293-315_t